MSHLCLMSALLATALAPAQETTSVRSGDDSFVVDLEQRYARILSEAEKSIVRIKVKREKQERRSNNPFLRRFMNSRMFGTRPNTPVTGVVLDDEGWILTTYFNVSGKVESINVLLPGGKEREATLKGYDAITDLAVLKIDADATLHPLDTRRVSIPKVGSGLVVVGSSPGRDGVTMNPGIVSALDRILGWGIQLDAKLNFGNTGGPVFDLNGRLIGLATGVSTANAASTGQNSGVGEAVLWSKVADSLPYLKRGGRNKGAYLGIQGETRPDLDGVDVKVVQEGTAAEKFGLQENDVIVEFDGHKVNTMGELRVLILRKRIGDRVTLVILRDDKEMKLDAELGERPES